MTLLERINKDIITSMKNKDNFRKGILKVMKSTIQNDALAKKPLKEKESLIGLYSKLTNFDKFKGKEIPENLLKEIKVIEEFIPKPLTPEELEALVDKHISLGDMRAVMKAVKAEVGGPFDGKFVSDMVRSKL